ncbi:MAG: DsrE family protein [Actinobacteria bacterium]|nr:DsrE family protein [Actinomycetota bacterium]
MATILVHIATGPENPTRAALGLLVARTAAEEGHDVRVFLAGDAVQLVRAETAQAATGIGTGSVSEHLEALASAGVPLFLSGMSSKARGVSAETRAGVDLVPPQKLVELATTSDTVLTY